MTDYEVMVSLDLGLSQTFAMMTPPKLSPRERQLLELFIAGKSNKEIAHQLCLAYVSVKQYCKSIYRKLGAHSRADAVIIAVRTGLVTLDHEPDNAQEQ